MYFPSYLALTLATCTYAISNVNVASYKPVAFKAPSPNVVTSNVLFLQRNSKPTKKGLSIRAVRSQGNGTFGIVNVTETSFGQEFLAPITVGGQNFKAIIDTGSSDTWLIRTGFQCFDPSTNAIVPESTCEFGPTYTPSNTFSQIPNENFNVSYGDGSYATGIVGNDDVTLAGITVKGQEIGVVDSTGFSGDGTQSGLIGFAFPSLTSVFSGTDGTHDGLHNQVEYNPLFTNMYTKGGVPPMFSLALTRGSWGGTLAIGGLPNVAHSPTFATSKLQLLNVQDGGSAGPIDNTTAIPQFQFYTITIQGFQIAGTYYGQHVGTFTTDAFGTPDDLETEQVIVDSGTTLNYVSDDVADVTNALFDPPAAYSEEDGVYYVDCDATPPEFGVDIGGQIFFINRDDMIIDEGYGNCITGISAVGESAGILGDVFLKNVLAVFDVGASEMRFAARETY